MQMFVSFPHAGKQLGSRWASIMKITNMIRCILPPPCPWQGLEQDGPWGPFQTNLPKILSSRGRDKTYPPGAKNRVWGWTVTCSESGEGISTAGLRRCHPHQWQRLNHTLGTRGFYTCWNKSFDTILGRTKALCWLSSDLRSKKPWPKASHLLWAAEKHGLSSLLPSHQGHREQNIYL